MTHTRFLALAATLAALHTLPATAAKPTAQTSPKPTPLVTVNGSVISTKMGDLLTQDLAARNGGAATQDSATVVRDELISRELLAQQARKLGLDKTPQFQARLQLLRQGIEVGAYLDHYFAEHPITDDAIRAEYQRSMEAAGPSEYKLRVIVLKTEEDASAVIRKLKAGEKFEVLASQSTDEKSRAKDGDLGWTRPATFVEPARSAVQQLAKGEYSASPVKIKEGYCIFLVDDIRKTEFPTLESIRNRVQQNLQQDALKKHTEDLRKAATIQ